VVRAALSAPDHVDGAPAVAKVAVGAAWTTAATWVAVAWGAIGASGGGAPAARGGSPNWTRYPF